MNAQQMNLDVIANNLANVNTTGFKKNKIEFQDMLYQSTRAAGADQGGGNVLPTGVEVGHGSRVVSTAKIFTDGDLTHTGEQLDLAVQGVGLFEVTLPDGTQAYTRAGAFKQAADGTIVTSDGYQVQSGFQPIPQGTTQVTIAPTGEVTASGAFGTQNLSRIQLARFNNPAGLQSIGNNLYVETEASGQAQLGNPGENGFGSLAQGSLEMSNVKVVEEMLNLIVAQRAYEVNSKAMQAADEMMQLSNNLRR